MCVCLCAFKHGQAGTPLNKLGQHRQSKAATPLTHKQHKASTPLNKIRQQGIYQSGDTADSKATQDYSSKALQQVFYSDATCRSIMSSFHGRDQQNVSTKTCPPAVDRHPRESNLWLGLGLGTLLRRSFGFASSCTGGLLGLRTLTEDFAHISENLLSGLHIGLCCSNLIKDSNCTRKCGSLLVVLSWHLLNHGKKRPQRA